MDAIKSLIQEALDNYIPKTYYNVREAAEYLRISESTVRKKIQKGELIPIPQYGGDKSTLRFTKAQLDYWVICGQKSSYNKRDKAKVKLLLNPII